MSNIIREAAARYIAKGWQVVPLAPGTKACKDDDWQQLTFKPEDFRVDDNIGIRSIGGIVDIDCDAPEVVAVASAFLPPTGAVYGRVSKPRCHWLYKSSFEQPLSYKDYSSTNPKNMLVEIRVDHQSMAPPSVHPEGEVLEWVEPVGDAETIEPERLHRSVRLLATCSLIARYYNPPGLRHDWGLALAGTLRQLGLDVNEAISCITQAGRYVNDDKVADRIRVFKDTYNKTDDDPLAGPKKLEDLMQNGRTFLQTIRKIWNAETLGISKSKLDQLNEKHAVLFQQSGELVVITEDSTPEGHKFLRFSSFETIRNLYATNVVVGFNGRNAPVTKKLGQAWLDSPRRRFYSGIELSPNGHTTPGYYNLWQGFAVEPKEGRWERFKEHINHIICTDVPELCLYVMTWMAQAVQHPERPANTAIALRGGQGTGKSTFAKWFGALFGAHFLHLDSTRHLTGNFNAHLHNAIVVFADEAAWPGDKAGLGALRRMVTEDTLTIERKGMDVFTVPNLIHLILASNEEWVVPAALDERRFAVLDVSRARQNDKGYFREIEHELFREGGLAAMLYDLLHFDTKMATQNIPKTKALYEQKRISSGPQFRWWFQILYDGELWNQRRGDGIYTIGRDFLYDNYVKVLDQAGSWGRTSKGLKTELGMFLKKVLPDGFPKDYREGYVGHTGPRAWGFPKLSVCREYYKDKFGITTEVDWPEEPKQADNVQF